jgi:hypothetical protein
MTAQQLFTGTDGRTDGQLTSQRKEDTDGNSVRRSAMFLSFRISSLHGKTTEREVLSFCASAAALLYITLPVCPLHYKDRCTTNI